MTESTHPEMPGPPARPFARALEECGLQLRRDTASTLQVNVGRLCDLACRHCHLEAGPASREVMDRATMDDVIGYARRCGFQTIDITGGAPELVPQIGYLIEQLAPLVQRLLFRTNLTAMHDHARELPELLRLHRVILVASLPSANASQAETQRGAGAFDKSIAMLKILNGTGYGLPKSGLLLDLVTNPTGAFLPAGQCALERKFRLDLLRKYGIVFSNLYTFANVPLGRFRRWLESSGNLEGYLATLSAAFNPATVPGLMCRSMVSVSWDGHLYDCDFNLAAGLDLGGERRHIARSLAPPTAGTSIATGEHCYACTAGSGFT